MTKYIFVTGGVVSSIGKGITSASLGRLLRNKGFSVAPMKLDPYINVDAGTMNPYQHGEVFVTEDGAETDLDLGHYERFIDVNCATGSSITTGRIYQSVIESERKGDYLGACVQVIPHVTNKIKESIKELAKKQKAEIVLAEIGGTVGDIESLPFLEAIRQFREDVGHENTLYVHVTLIPTIGPWKELKTKPTQHSVVKLREIGLTPDVLVCRTEEPLPKDVRDKISLFCGVPKNAIVESQNVETIYEVPLKFEKAGLSDYVLSKFNLKAKENNHKEWEKLVATLKNPKKRVRIAVVGKYVGNGDAYKSIDEALIHAGIPHQANVEIVTIESERFETDLSPEEAFKDVDGIIVAPGFGPRGIEGKIKAITYVRENKIPYLGICYGLQWAVVEYARNVCGLTGANSEENEESPKHNVIHLLPEQHGVKTKGGTMRLGSYRCNIAAGTLAHKLYGKSKISERHRHRFEVNNDYREQLKEAGMIISGVSPDYRLVEMVELKDHPFFIATQAHPEFKSRLNKPCPLFQGLIGAAIDYSVSKNTEKQKETIKA